MRRHAHFAGVAFMAVSACGKLSSAKQGKGGLSCEY